MAVNVPSACGGEQTRLDITRELVVHCTSRLITVADRAHRKALRDVLMKDLRAQVVVR